MLWSKNNLPAPGSTPSMKCDTWAGSQVRYDSDMGHSGERGGLWGCCDVASLAN